MCIFLYEEWLYFEKICCVTREDFLMSSVTCWSCNCLRNAFWKRKNVSGTLSCKCNSNYIWNMQIKVVGGNRKQQFGKYANLKNCKEMFCLQCTSMTSSITAIYGIYLSKIYFFFFKILCLFKFWYVTICY